MAHEIDFLLASSEDIETVLSRRLEEIRLSRNITQSHLAKEAGVSRSTITRLAQEGKGISLDSFIRILKALHLHGHLEALLPDPSVSPLRLLEGKKSRQRARSKKSKTKSWTWNVGDVET